MICPNCGKLISVSEEQCPFCGAWRPGLYGYAPAIQKLFGNRLDMVPLIVMTCIVLYVAALILQPEAILQTSGMFSILSPGSRALYQLGMTGGIAWELGWWWTLLTAIYLHGGILHIFFNVMWIRNLGPQVDEAFGPARGFVIFSLAGAFGFLVSNIAGDLMTGPGVLASSSVGASGSIFGLLAALIVYGRRTGSQMLTTQLWTWALILFAFGFFMRGVDNWAHGGGFASGWVVAQFMPLSHERRESLWVQVLALVLLATTVVGFVLSFVRVTGMLLGR